MPSVASAKEVSSSHEQSQGTLEAGETQPGGSVMKRKIRGRGARYARAGEGESPAGGWLRGYGNREEEDTDSRPEENWPETPKGKKPATTTDISSNYSNPQFVPTNPVFYLHDRERVSQVEIKSKVWGNSFEPTGSKKWGHDMYDTICDRNKKHTRVDHFEKSYGFQWPAGRPSTNSKILCYNWKKKRHCYNGTNCKFSHGEDDEKISRGICVNWNRGTCRNGYNCRYFHGSNVWENKRENGYNGEGDGERGNVPYHDVAGIHGLTRYYPEDEEYKRSQDAYIRSLQKPDSDDWNGTPENFKSVNKAKDHWSANSAKSNREGGDYMHEGNASGKTAHNRTQDKEVRTAQRNAYETPKKHPNNAYERVKKNPQSKGWASKEVPGARKM